MFKFCSADIITGVNPTGHQRGWVVGLGIVQSKVIYTIEMRNDHCALREINGLGVGWWGWAFRLGDDIDPTKPIWQ